MPGGLSSVICVVEGNENGTLNCLAAASECMLRSDARRWRLSGFTNVHWRAVLGNSDGSSPWSCPDPAGVNYVWARHEET
eukprot:7892303-Alexandrium_andersonii.AAC.1